MWAFFRKTMAANVTGSITELHGSSGIQKKPEATGSTTTQLRLVLEEHFQAQS